MKKNCRIRSEHQGKFLLKLNFSCSIYGPKSFFKGLIRIKFYLKGRIRIKPTRIKNPLHIGHISIYKCVHGPGGTLFGSLGPSQHLIRSGIMDQPRPPRAGKKYFYSLFQSLLTGQSRFDRESRIQERRIL